MLARGIRSSDQISVSLSLSHTHTHTHTHTHSLSLSLSVSSCCHTQSITENDSAELVMDQPHNLLQRYSTVLKVAQK